MAPAPLFIPVSTRQGRRMSTRMSEKQNRSFRLSFNTSLKIGFQRSRVNSYGDLILVHKLDERLGFGDLIVRCRRESRRGKNAQVPLPDLLCQSVYRPIASYEDCDGCRAPFREDSRRSCMRALGRKTMPVGRMGSPEQCHR